MKECCRPRQGLNTQPPGLQSDGAYNWATKAALHPGELKMDMLQIHDQYGKELKRLNI